MRFFFTATAILALFLIAVPAPAQDTAPADVAGTWTITITFLAGESTHTAVITQDGARLSGTYKGQFGEGRVGGSVEGATVQFRGSLRHEAQSVSYGYSGTITGDTMSGTVDLGEFWSAKFTAKRIKK